MVDFCLDNASAILNDGTKINGRCFPKWVVSPRPTPTSARLVQQRYSHKARLLTYPNMKRSNHQIVSTQCWRMHLQKGDRPSMTCCAIGKRTRRGFPIEHLSKTSFKPLAMRGTNTTPNGPLKLGNGSPSYSQESTTTARF